MKKRKNIILSAITCFVSICMLMFGVYSATNPSVSLRGQVSYTARDAKILVQGKVNGSKNQILVDYPSATITTNDVTATKVTNKSTQYLDYTAGTGNSASDNLSPWSIGTLEFVEDNNGINDIVISFKLTNLSTYPVQASVTFGKTDSELASANVIRNASATSAVLSQNGGSKELTIIYSVKDDSKSVVASDLLNMNITFEKTLSSTTINNSASEKKVKEINENNGLVTMGKTSNTATVEDVQWRCFAYSTDGTTWTKNDGTIPTTAKYGYFLMDTYVDGLKEVDFLASSKYNSSTYMNTNISGVYAYDYYYSDIRQTLKSLESTLNIDTSSEIYNAISARTVTDLYKNNHVDAYDIASSMFNTSDQKLPTSANKYETDKFWIMSVYEAQTYFSDNASRKYQNSGKPYWLRSPWESATGQDKDYLSCIIDGDGNFNNTDLRYNGKWCARPAFKLQFAVSNFVNSTQFVNTLNTQSIDPGSITSIKFTNSESNIPSNPTKTFSLGAIDKQGTTAFTSDADCYDITAYYTGTSLVAYSPYTIFAPVDSSNLFKQFTAITTLNLDNFDTRNTTTMTDMLKVTNLKSLTITDNFTNQGTEFTKARLMSVTGLPNTVAVQRGDVTLKGYTVSFTSSVTTSGLDSLSITFTYEDGTTKTVSSFAYDYGRTGGTPKSEYNVIGLRLEAADSRYIYYTMNGKRDVLYNLGTGKPSAYLELTGDINFELEWMAQDCILANSLVTMADGTFKRLGDIKTGDYILSYDWETKKLVSNKVIYASSEDAEKVWTTIRYFRRTFSDGTIIDNAFAHRFYNIEKGCFAYLEEWEIGDHIYKGDGTTPYLVSVETIYEDCTFGRITGENGTNYFANGFLTGDRHCPSGLTLEDLKDSINFDVIPPQNA